ncbi:hypothetical protein SKAU_G00291320 [Synaphobranchus kaupii]|uniref:Uncharacterized protein n=1 Tax=Synaphobranchus kaupii TaxID=118154 RepID=A0A9Q1IM43_SYNKA|nr:hypothetical protein SKAU_G00291320 [Synaphobranchus kaupii]
MYDYRFTLKYTDVHLSQQKSMPGMENNVHLSLYILDRRVTPCMHGYGRYDENSERDHRCMAAFSVAHCQWRKELSAFAWGWKL